MRYSLIREGKLYQFMKNVRMLKSKASSLI